MCLLIWCCCCVIMTSYKCTIYEVFVQTYVKISENLPRKINHQQTWQILSSNMMQIKVKFFIEMLPHSITFAYWKVIRFADSLDLANTKVWRGQLNFLSFLVQLVSNLTFSSYFLQRTRKDWTRLCLKYKTNLAQKLWNVSN